MGRRKKKVKKKTKQTNPKDKHKNIQNYTQELKDPQRLKKKTTTSKLFPMTVRKPKPRV